MSTPHNEAKKEEIAKNVIMPGDPLRAKYIAEKYLEEAKLVNTVRGMYAYTGKYKGKEITVMAHGMGCPSVGIYSYELFKAYNVDNIIRIGTCGGMKTNLDLMDIVLSKEVYSESNYALALNNDDCHRIKSSESLNEKIIGAAKKNNINIACGQTLTLDCFGPYMTNEDKFLERVPKDFDPLTEEMEAFALFYNAKLLNKNASCIMTVVDCKGKSEIVSKEEREKGLDKMILIALEAIS